MDICQEYLIHSYLYYDCDENIILDSAFDVLCLDILWDWEKIDSPYKTLIDKESLEAGSGYSCRYPEEIKTMAKDRLEIHQDVIAAIA